MRFAPIIVGAAVCTLFVISPIIHLTTKETLRGVTITDKERVQNGEDSKYLIWSDAETFENTDSLLGWKFGSSDLYGALKIGSTCDIDVVGFRAPFLSMYRNILDARCA